MVCLYKYFLNHFLKWKSVKNGGLFQCQRAWIIKKDWINLIMSIISLQLNFLVNLQLIFNLKNDSQTIPLSISNQFIILKIFYKRMILSFLFGGVNFNISNRIHVKQAVSDPDICSYICLKYFFKVYTCLFFRNSLLFLCNTKKLISFLVKKIN